MLRNGNTRENRDKTRDGHEKDPEIGNVYFHEIEVLIGNVYFGSVIYILIRQIPFQPRYALDVICL